MGTMHLPTTQGAPSTGHCGMRQQQVAAMAFCSLVIMMLSLSYEWRDGYGSDSRCKSETARGRINCRRGFSHATERCQACQAPLHTAFTERLAWYLRWIGRESVRGQQHERQRVGSEAVTTSAGVCIDACIHSYLATRRAMCQETETERMRFHRQTPRSFSAHFSIEGCLTSPAHRWYGDLNRSLL